MLMLPPSVRMAERVIVRLIPGAAEELFLGDAPPCAISVVSTLQSRAFPERSMTLPSGNQTVFLGVSRPQPGNLTEAMCGSSGKRMADGGMCSWNLA